MKLIFSGFIAFCVLTGASIASAAGTIAPSITTSNLPAATVKAPYSMTLDAGGGTAPYKWDVNRLPAGLSLSKAGILSGIPKAAGSTAMKFSVRDRNNRTSSRTLALQVAKAPVQAAATLKASLPSPQIPGQPVTFTAGMLNGKDTYEYQFMYVDPVYPTLLLTAQSYSSSNTWTINTANNPYKPGDYPVTVYVRKTGSTAVYDYSASLVYKLVPPPLPTGLTLRSSFVSPQESGKHITFIAKTATGSSYAEYWLTVTYPDGSVHVLAGAPDAFLWGDANGEVSVIWNSFGLPAGNYTITVYAKSAYSTSVYDLTKSMTYTLTPSTVVLPQTDPYKYGRVLFEKGTNANPRGAFYVFGDSPGYIFIAKYDADWNLLWMKSDVSGGQPAFDRDGNITMLSGGFKKMAPDGNVLTSWPIPGMAAPASYTVDSDGNVFVAWSKYVAGSGSTITVQAFSASGSSLWNWSGSPEFVVAQSTCNNGPTATVTGIAADANGNIHLSGITANNNVRFAGVAGPYFLTFDSIGNKVANVSVPNTGGKIFPDGQGNYIAIGEEPPVVVADPAATITPTRAVDITKFDVNGTIVWQKQLIPSYSGFNLIIRDITQDKDGSFYFLTSPTLPGTPKIITNKYPGVAVTKVDVNGNKQWAVTGGTTPEEWIYPLMLAVDDLGNMYVKSSTDIPGGSYHALIKFAADGKQEWLK